MNEPIRTQWEIRCAFNGFCKQALKREAMNAHRDTKRQQSREVTFSDLSPQEENQLYTYDKYFANDEAEQSFFIAGKEITVVRDCFINKSGLFSISNHSPQFSGIHNGLNHTYGVLPLQSILKAFYKGHLMSG